MTIETMSHISLEEAQALESARQAGTLSAQLYRHGIFSQPDFVLFGVLERLVIRRRLVYLGLSGDEQNSTYTYRLPEAQVASKPVLAAA